jgi:formate-dependent nitrite reductase membrane component NrfD
MSQESQSYYDRPVVKEPVWIWAVPAYFFVGGMAGAAATLGGLAQILGRGNLDGLIRRCRALAAAGSAAGGGLLIHDLGRPERFLNMLRVFRPTSPMSMGSWMLAAVGSLSSLSLVADKRSPALANVAGFGAGVLGPPFSGYTGVLLSDTSIPVWAAASKGLPVLFVASSMSTATALLEAMDLSDEEATIVWRLGFISEIAELLAGTAVEREASGVERVGRPLSEGVSSTLWKASKFLTSAGLGVSMLGKKKRWAARLSTALGVSGALALRFALWQAGRASARDPQATFELQRARR